MNTGHLRHPLNLQRPELTQDPETGAMAESWRTVSREWASIEGVDGETTYRVTIRHRDDLDATWRLVSGSVTYGIAAIQPGNKPVWLVLICKEI